MRRREFGKAHGKVVLVGGPTASGKSELALRLAETCDGVVINADSMQVYRELRILTARPGPAEEARAPHVLYGMQPAAQACSAARWCDLARGEIAAAEAAGKLPILVGGTGLYFRALIEGLAPVPEIPAATREEVRKLHRDLGPAAFHAALTQCDPAMAARLQPGDTQRVIRAFEVRQATGISLADWQERPGGAAKLTQAYAMVVLEPPRAELYARCDARFLAMLQQGGLTEVAALEALGLDPALPAMKALGVPELRRHLRGEITLKEAVVAAQQATRRYAKRQTTWFRHQIDASKAIFTQFSESREAEIFAFIRCFLLTEPG